MFKFYDYGPKDVPPLVFIPGASGTAEVFYKQFLSLCPKGYRLISVQLDETYNSSNFFVLGSISALHDT